MQQTRGDESLVANPLLPGQIAATHVHGGTSGSIDKLKIGQATGLGDITFWDASTTYVNSFNSMTGAVSLLSGTGVSISVSGSNVIVTNTGVTAFNSLTGGVSLVAGTGISLSTSGNTITLNATGGGASGTVTNVAIAAPSSVFAISGSPVTTSGTLSLAFVNQSANTLFASPDGSSGAPSFRALAAGDIPTLDASKIGTGVFATARLGSGSASSSTYLRGDGSWQTPPTSSGTVTSVALTAPAGTFSITGSPITGSGTFAIGLVSQSPNVGFLGPPSGGSGIPTWRALVALDIPGLPASQITSGQFGTSLLGSGSASSSTYLRGDGTWQIPPASGGSTSPGGSDTQVQINESGTFAGDATFSYAYGGNKALSSGSTASGGGYLVGYRLSNYQATPASGDGVGVGFFVAPPFSAGKPSGSFGMLFDGTNSNYVWNNKSGSSIATLSQTGAFRPSSYVAPSGAAGVSGTSGGGDTVVSGLITALGTGSGGTSPTIARLTVPFLQGKTPTGTGADTYEYVLPAAPGGGTLYFTPAAARIRIQTPASSGTTTVSLDWSSGTGAWSSIQILKGVSVSATNYEQSGAQPAMTVPASTPRTGDKLRATISSLGTGAAGITFEIEFELSTTDPL